jgi:dTMP kinase
MKRGHFIVFEGIDGAGTTTQLNWALSALTKQGLQAMGTREPSDGPVGTMIRDMLKGRIIAPNSTRTGGPEIDPKVIALLFAADRLDHLDNEIDPSLMADRWVLSDRYIDSSLAYQSIYMDLNWVKNLNSHARVPDLTIYLAVTPEVGMKRIMETRTSTDHFETLDRLKLVHKKYEMLVKDRKDVVKIDGEQSKVSVHAEVMQALDHLIG